MTRAEASSAWLAPLPFNSFVSAAVAIKFRSAVREVLQRGSSCVPRGMVMFSIVNRGWASTRALALSKVSGLACLMRRFVSLCLDGFSDGFGDCVDAPPVNTTRQFVKNTGRDLMGFRSLAYHELTWAVWLLAHAAMQEASYALYVDADVVLLTNPFAHLDTPRASLLYAEELSDCSKAKGHLRPCSNNPCKLNAGLFLVSSARLTSDILSGAHPKSFGRRTPIQQDLVVRWIRSAMASAGNHTFCRLPSTFAGLCSEALGVPLPRPCDQVIDQTKSNTTRDPRQTLRERA